MTGNQETLTAVLNRIESGKFTGKVVLHCNEGRIEVYEVNERHHAPWRNRVAEPKRDS